MKALWYDIFGLNALLGGAALINIHSNDLKSFAVTPPAVLNDFKNIDFTDIGAAIQGITDFVKGLNLDSGFLNVPLPLVNVSLKDVIDFATELTDTVTDFIGNPMGRRRSDLRGYRQ